MKATIQDICLRDRYAFVFCDYEPHNPRGVTYIRVDVFFDQERWIGPLRVLDSNDNDLSETLPAPIYTALLLAIKRDFNPERLVRDHLMDHDGEAGKLFRSVPSFEEDHKYEDYKDRLLWEEDRRTT